MPSRGALLRVSRRRPVTLPTSFKEEESSLPSWNIHIAHAEAVLAREGGLAAAVRDRNAFLFGNVLPDIRVGYMVPGIADPIPYRTTHFARPEHIPKPREWEFWDAYVVPAFDGAALSGIAVDPAEAVEQVAGSDPMWGETPAGIDLAQATPCPLFTLGQERERINRVHYPQRYVDAGAPVPVPGDTASAGSVREADFVQSLRDMVLGTWLHLLADNVWNVRVNEYLDSTGDRPSEGFRIKKQGDFDQFGKTLSISSIVHATDRLTAAASRFPQYPLSRDEVLYTVAVIHETVRENPGNPEHRPYRLLNDGFFSSTFAEVANQAERLFAERTRA